MTLNQIDLNPTTQPENRIKGNNIFAIPLKRMHHYN